MVSTPLKHISQLGWLFSIWKNRKCSKPPTSDQFCFGNICMFPTNEATKSSIFIPFSSLFGPAQKLTTAKKKPPRPCRIRRHWIQWNFSRTAGSPSFAKIKGLMPSKRLDPSTSSTRTRFIDQLTMFERDMITDNFQMRNMDQTSSSTIPVHQEATNMNDCRYQWIQYVQYVTNKRRPMPHNKP